MRRLLLISTAALALSVAMFAAWSMNGGNSQKAEAAHTPITCSVSLTPPTETVTCKGDIVVITPFGTKIIHFELVVDATDNPPSGPSWGDQVTGCTIALNGGAPRPIHIGPCP